MTTTTATGRAAVIRARSPEEFLAFVPTLVGFRPRDSVVLVPFADGRTLGALRFDLPCTTDDAALAGFASSACGIVLRLRRTDAVAIVVYTDASFSAIGRVPEEETAFALIRRVRGLGWELKDALCVASDGFGSYLGDDRPATGSGLELIEAHRRRLERQDPRNVRVLDLEAETSLAEPSGRRRSAFRSHHARMRAVLSAAAAGVGAFGEPVDGARASGVGAALFAEAGCAPDVGSLADAALRRGRADRRDRVLALTALVCDLDGARCALAIAWVWGGDTAERIASDVLAGARNPLAEPAAGFVGLPRPDPGRLGRATEVVRAIAALLPEEDRASAYVQLAWLYWTRGLATIASTWASRAVAIDPSDGFASAILRACSTGGLPEWAFDHGR